MHAPYTAKQARKLAEFFSSHPDCDGAYIWNGSPQTEPQPGASLAHYISRQSCLKYSSAGNWQSEVNFLDKLDEEDFTWELARRGVSDPQVLFPTVVDRL